jgi:hypothetical protein
MYRTLWQGMDFFSLRFSFLKEADGRKNSLLRPSHGLKKGSEPFSQTNFRK